jgi:hypothetical protein
MLKKILAATLFATLLGVVTSADPAVASEPVAPPGRELAEPAENPDVMELEEKMTGAKCIAICREKGCTKYQWFGGPPGDCSCAGCTN